MANEAADMAWRAMWEGLTRLSPEEKLIDAVRGSRMASNKKWAKKAIPLKDRRELKRAEILTLAEDIPEEQMNPFVRGALIEVTQEPRMPLKEMDEALKMVQAIRRRLGYLVTAPPSDIN